MQLTEWQVLAATMGGSPAPTIAEDRVRVDMANETDVMPYVIGHKYKVSRDYGLDNTLLSATTIFHIECWGETREQAQILSDQVVECLAAEGYVMDDNGPDGVDPTADARCVDLYLSVIDTPPIF